jgi:hypothetical protein
VICDQSAQAYERSVAWVPAAREGVLPRAVISAVCVDALAGVAAEIIACDVAELLDAA